MPPNASSISANSATRRRRAEPITRTLRRRAVGLRPPPARAGSPSPRAPGRLRPTISAHSAMRSGDDSRATSSVELAVLLGERHDPRCTSVMR